MITAKPTRKGRIFWGTFSRLSIAFAFKELKAEWKAGGSFDLNSILLIGNHISWWDGFFALRLNQLLFHKDFYIMMLEDELRKRPFMREGGAFSINPGSRSIIQSLDYSAEKLADKNTLLVIYPQGSIHSLYDHPVRFAPGLGHLLKKVPEGVRLIAYVALVDYAQFSRPTLHIRLKELTLSPVNSIQDIERQYNAFFQEALEDQCRLYTV